MKPIKKMTKSDKYVKAIRNHEKREYANLFLAYLRYENVPEPPLPENLSYMAAQAVRMALRDLEGK